MIISLDMTSSTPIYIQLRNQIVIGIGKGELAPGERLPTVRQLANDAGVNTMTVNKAYQMLKNEGFIEADRRKGASVCKAPKTENVFKEKIESELELLSAEAAVKGMGKEDFLDLCEQMFSHMHPAEPLGC